MSDATAATHEENGWYEKELDATDTDTVGILIVAVNESGALPVWREFQVIEEAVYDRDYAAAATGIVGTAQTGDAFARLGAPAGASHAADVAAVKSDTVEILTDTSVIGAPVTTVAGDIAAITAAIGTPVTTIAGDIAVIEAQTDDIGVAGAGLTALATAANLATVDTVVDAIKAKTDSLTFTVAGVVDANIQRINDVTITGDGQVGTEFGV